MYGAISLNPDNPVNGPTLCRVGRCSTSLFTKNEMRVSVKELEPAWSLPGRAILLGLPLTLFATALLGHWLVGIPWAESFLLGAALSPTSTCVCSRAVGREDVPARLRQLLNVESGFENDGLAMPVVVTMLAVVGKERVKFSANNYRDCGRRDDRSRRAVDGHWPANEHAFSQHTQSTNHFQCFRNRAFGLYNFNDRASQLFFGTICHRVRWRPLVLRRVTLFIDWEPFIRAFEACCIASFRCSHLTSIPHCNSSLGIHFRRSSFGYRASGGTNAFVGTKCVVGLSALFRRGSGQRDLHPLYSAS